MEKIFVSCEIFPTIRVLLMLSLQRQLKKMRFEFTVSRISKYCYHIFVWQFTFHNQITHHTFISRNSFGSDALSESKTLCNIDRSYLVFLSSCFSGFSLPMYVFKKNPPSKTLLNATQANDRS